MGTGEDPEDASQQQQLIDGDGQAHLEIETDVPKRSRRCIRTPPLLGVATLVLLILGVYGLTRAPKVPQGPPPNDDVSPDRPEGGNRAEYPAYRARANWLKFHEKLKVEAEEQGEDARVLVLGDSITEELLGTSMGVPRENWGSTQVWAEYYEGLGSLNLGVSGDQTQHLLWRMQNGELPDVLQPQSIMVAIGTNNLGYGMSAEDTVGGIKAVVKDLREQRPDALIVVIGLFPRASYKTRTDTTPWEIIDEVNTLLEHMLKLNFGEEKVHFVNCNERFLTEDSTGHQALNYELLLEDNLHLTPAGLEEWAKCASEDIRSGLTDP